MGGRGGNLKFPKGQHSFREEKIRRDVEEILEKSEKKRASLNFQNEGVYSEVSSNQKKKCACCGKYTIPVGTDYEICSICGWVDDPYQNQHPNSLNGKNPITLNQARQDYVNRS